MQREVFQPADCLGSPGITSWEGMFDCFMTKTQTFHGPTGRVRLRGQRSVLSSARPNFAVKRSRGRGAFTLVELLVVIAVIAILAALLLPVLSRTKLKAMQTQCLSNLKQMALAHTMYLSDYHETCFPYDTTTGNNLLWMGRLIDYQARVDTVRICPAASDTNAPDRFGTADKAWHHDSKSPVQRWYGSYSLNGWLYSNLINRNTTVWILVVEYQLVTRTAFQNLRV
jgi:prepilin-type N-terminal cleavage/methylation domain-containing protein